MSGATKSSPDILPEKSSTGASEPDLVVIAEDWGGLPSSTQHLVRRLAADRRVLWVNSLGLRRPRFSGRDLRRLASKGRAAISGLRPTSPQDPPSSSFRILPPIALPLPGSALAQRINRALVGWQIRRAVVRSGMERPVLWTSMPTGVAALDAFESRAIVYYCGDDFSALDGVDHTAVASLEIELSRRADLIVAASDAIAARFPPEKTIVLPHGVDFELFSRPVARAADLPAGRIAGYYGSISKWLDFGLIADVAQRMPNWTFVLIGPVQCDVSSIAKLPNVRLVGPRPHRDLPRYAQHWSASLMPFRNSGHVPAGNPLKLREYLAAGPPIVATSAAPAVKQYAELIEIADSPASFCAALERALTDTGRNAARRRCVATEDWAHRASELSAALRKAGRPA